MNSLYGLPVYINDLQVQKKALVHKSWHYGRSYFARVNKKWRKRYGTTMVIENGSTFQTPQGIFMNSHTWKQLQTEIKQQPDTFHVNY